MKYTHAVLGGSGHIGLVLADRLRARQQKVLVIGHDESKAGNDYAMADILDSVRLRELFGQVERVFILNPPAPPDSDTDAVERAQIKSILDALEGLALQKVVAASTYGAQPGEHLYDLGTLYDLEQGLHRLSVPVAIIRGAYYMSNFDQTIPAVKEKGELVTLFPADFKFPMVDPTDIGAFAAELMMDERTGLFFVEGPETYSNQDAAQIFGELLGREVKVVPIPESGWQDFMMKGGFSEKAAASFVNMIRVTIHEPFIAPSPMRGTTTLKNYLWERLK